ncbi:MAG: phosphoribosylaminoimidazolesuccinocarboxamide synthase [Bacteroidales bacterium]|nr:phosphoribosylaminoimidazolesuccinocarboxamide synthase [Bacteroidales bacterium]
MTPRQNKQKTLVNAITETSFQFPGQTAFYKGKVRDVYTIDDNILIMIVTDRISAFDVVLPKGIPYKGQALNQIASGFLDATSDIVPNWKIASPDPMVTAGISCNPFKVEMVIRGYLSGHAWRLYQQGARTICGVRMPEGLKENDPFPTPIITPTTKAAVGHDEDISAMDILSHHIVHPAHYEHLEYYTHALYNRGCQMAKERGLILVDTKYEFGYNDDQIYLIDEIHTPDSSRYFYLDGYHERQEQGLPQKQLSKEFVRQWLIENNFQGKEGQVVPDMSDEFVNQVSDRYIELYEQITGSGFVKADGKDIPGRIEQNCLNFISEHAKK